MTISDNPKALKKKLNVSKELLNKMLDSEGKNTLYSYMDCLNDAILDVSGLEINEFDKVVFQRNILFRDFLKRISIYDKEMEKNYIINKDYHKDFFNHFLFDMCSFNNEIYNKLENISYTSLEKEDFYNIFYEFMNSLGLSPLFDFFIKNNNIYNNKNMYEGYEGLTLYNPILKDSDIFITNFDYTIYSMFVLAHEFGHVYDFELFSDNVENYNRYLYQSFYHEVISKLFERLFLKYLIDKDIMRDEAENTLLLNESSNSVFVMNSYILSLLDGDILKNDNYKNLSSEDLVDRVYYYFSNYNYIKYYIENSCFDILSDYNYAYGAIISMCLEDDIKRFGFSEDVLHSFLEDRTQMFQKEFMEKNNFTSSRYLDLYNKQLKLIKK